MNYYFIALLSIDKKILKLFIMRIVETTYKLLDYKFEDRNY